MSWFSRLFLRRQIYSDLAEEIQQHLSEKIEALMAEGMSRDEAEHAAKRAFGMQPGSRSLGERLGYGLKRRVSSQTLNLRRGN